MWVGHDSFISNGRVIYSFESLITLKQPSTNIRGRQNHSLEIGPESLYTTVQPLFQVLLRREQREIEIMRYRRTSLGSVIPNSSTALMQRKFPDRSPHLSHHGVNGNSVTHRLANNCNHTACIIQMIFTIEIFILNF